MITLFTFLSVFFLVSTSWADMTALNQAPNTAQLAPVINISDIHPSSELSTDLQKITIAQPLKQVKKPMMVIPVRTQTAGWVGKFKSEDFENQSEINHQAVLAGNKKLEGKYAGFLKTISPDYVVNRNFLSLTKVPQDRRKRAIMFVFFMNKKTIDPEKRLILKNDTRSRLHIMGPKRIMTEQKVVDDEYPINLSIAKREDGYSSDEWNLILPGKKPREILVSLLWNF